MKPHLGRIVLFQTTHGPCPAVVVRVHSDDSVSLRLISLANELNGQVKRSVRQIEPRDGGETPPIGTWHWVPEGAADSLHHPSCAAQ